MARAAIDQTFGVEFEFICVYPPGTFGDLVQDVDDYCEYEDNAGPCAGQAIFLKLQKRGIPATGWESEDDNDWASEPSYSRWLVKEDGSLYLSDEEETIVPEDWVIEPIEIASRKLRLSDASAAEIKAVLEEIFALESLGCRMLTNHSTGLHVHIGYDHQYIPLETAKRVYQLGTVFAPAMDKIHAYPRIEPIPEEGDSRCFLPPGYFHTHNGQNAPTANVFDWLSSIQRVSSYKDLSSLFVTEYATGSNLFGRTTSSTSGHNSCYNFDNLVLPPDFNDSDITKTIEFRQHRGTLDYSAAIAWIALVSQMVTFCQTAKHVDFFALLVYGVNPTTTIRDFCSGIGLADVFTSYFTGESDLPRSQLPSSSAGLLTSGEHDVVLKALTEINDHESSEYVDPEAVDYAIAHKLNRGLYGIDPSVNIIQHPREAIAKYYRATLGLVKNREALYHFDPNLTVAQRTSPAKEHLLTYLARLHAGDIQVEQGGVVFERSANVMRFDLPEEYVPEDEASRAVRHLFGLPVVRH